MPMLHTIMGRAEKEFFELDGLAVSIGPGTFTGVRVGLAAARGLALAAKKPLLGVGTLHAMARGARGDVPILVAVDARRETLYCQSFTAQKKPLDTPRALSLAEAQQKFPKEARVEVVGSGKVFLAAAAPRFQASAAADYPLAENVARLAAATPLAEWPRVPPEPLYLRGPDAKLPSH